MLGAIFQCVCVLRMEPYRRSNGQFTGGFGRERMPLGQSWHRFGLRISISRLTADVVFKGKFTFKGRGMEGFTNTDTSPDFAITANAGGVALIKKAGVQFFDGAAALVIELETEGWFKGEFCPTLAIHPDSVRHGLGHRCYSGLGDIALGWAWGAIALSVFAAHGIEAGIGIQMERRFSRDRPIMIFCLGYGFDRIGPFAVERRLFP